MPVRAVHDAGSFDWFCANCGHEHTGHQLDPQGGQLTVHHLVHGYVLLIGRRAGCGATESLRSDIPPWETGEVLHPDSLVGTRLPGPNGDNIVVEHHIGGVIESGLSEEHREWARLHRLMQRHPHLEPHAPLPTYKARRWEDAPGAELIDA